MGWALIPISGIILVLLLICGVKPTFAAYDSSYVFLEIRNVRTEASRTICANYQQFRRKLIAESPETAKPLKIGWWNSNINNYDVCESDNSANLSSTVVPALYRVNKHSAERSCPILQTLDWKARFPFVVNRIELAGPSVALFLVRRGQAYYEQFDDYLFADFRDPYLGQNKSFPPVSIPIFYTYISRFQDEVLSMSEKKDSSDLELRFYRPHSFEIDGAMAIILFLSVFSVAVGGWWSGRFRMQLWKEELLAQKKRFLVEPNDDKNEHDTVGDTEQSTVDDSASVVENGQNKREKEEEREPPAAPFTWVTVLIFVVVIVGMLLLLYYFYGYLVWFIIVMFTFASCMATYNCLSALMDPITCGRCRTWSLADLYTKITKREFTRNCRSCKERPMFRNCVLFFCCAAVSICWCIFRKWAFSFVIQDILSVFFCIHLIKTLRIPSLKWLTILLVALLVYDLFMVFITPFFTKDGCSIMVEVATGGGCDQGENTYPRPPQYREQLPIIFRVPRVTDPVLSCYDLSVDLQFPPMMLGLGDVILPGLLVGFCFAMDFIWKVKYHIYGAVSVCAYGLGMVITFGALMLMKRAQPALIYLVPLTLIPVIIVAKAKRQLGLLWRGEMPVTDLFISDDTNASAPFASSSGVTSYSAADINSVQNGMVDGSGSGSTIQ